ncbi:MAG: hypothetical protein B6243_00045 [Anaerolineaceae bacterium 4572_5.2]|nr:MAG: hypothetical protein B6243_00045 [Anaerolineaceae bacterium 4572_5.2]
MLMELLNQILTLYNWGVFCILLFFLFWIARFFEQRLSEKKDTKKSLLYPFFLVPMILFFISAVIYALSGKLIVGNQLADILRIIGGIIFAAVGFALLQTMMGGRT